MMTEALELSEKVLEVGTGSGYQAAVLAELARHMVTSKCLAPLAKSAKKVLDSLGYTNVEVHLAEETLGWPKGAPYTLASLLLVLPGCRLTSWLN